MFALKKPAETQPAAAVAGTPTTETPTEAAPEPQITAVIGEPGVQPAPAAKQEERLAEAAPPEESTPQEIVGTEGSAPKEAPTGTAAVALASPEPLTVEKTGQPAVAAQPEQSPAEPVRTEVTGPTAIPPAQPVPAAIALASPAAPAPEKAPETVAAQKPPETAVGAQKAPRTVTAQKAPEQTTKPTGTRPAAPTATTQTVAAASLPRGTPGTFFLQLGAYAQENVARDLAAKLSPTYPTLVLSPSGPGTAAYRVVIGPLNRAESGTLLLWFRHKGYPDAFLRAE